MSNWTYSQSTGVITNGQTVGHGYSGAGEGKNNPAMDHVENVGPTPRGWFTMAERLECTSLPCADCHGQEKHKHGPDVIRLIPDPENEMHGRAGFLCHGDNLTHTASEGCIVQDHTTRMAMHQSADRRIQVVEEV